MFVRQKIWGPRARVYETSAAAVNDLLALATVQPSCLNYFMEDGGYDTAVLDS